MVGFNGGGLFGDLDFDRDWEEDLPFFFFFLEEVCGNDILN